MGVVAILVSRQPSQNIEFKMSQKVLVTGSEGFIGSHLVEELIEQGYAVKAFVLYNSFNSWGWLDTLPKEILSQIEIVTGDVRDPFGVKNAMQGCDAVLHLAALIAIPYSYHSPSTYIETNVQGTLNIVQAAKELNLSKVIHTSTSEVYGTAQFVPITEEHPLQGQSPYSASKIGADCIAMSYYTSFETPVTTIRPFNTYGPRQSARAILPTIITQLADGCSELKLGDLTPTRDFNFVKDTAQGFVAALQSDGIAGETINLASNYEISMQDVVNTIVELMGSKAQVVTDEARLRPKNSEVFRLWGDNNKAKKLLNWQPAFGGLEGFRKGIQNTIDWFSNSENRKNYKSDIYNI